MLIVWQLMTSVYVAPEPVQPLLSVTVTTIGNEPVCVGVPLSTPLLERVRPVGSVLAVVNVAVPIAPFCVNVCENAELAVPVVTPGFVTAIVWQPITIVYVALVPVQPFESVAVTVTGTDPVCVGVPLSTPLLASVRPAGSVPLASVYVAVPIAPVCVNVSLNAALAVPFPFAGLFTVIVWQAITIVYVDPVPVQPFASVAVTVTGNDPVCVGVPLSTPLLASVRPVGSVPVANV
jgi:hypothetical protein